MPKKLTTTRGRKRTGKNKGYFYYAGRGWFAIRDGKKVPLCDEHGERIRARNTPDGLLREALNRLLSQPLSEQPAEAADEAALSPSVREVVKAYLASIQHDNPKTYEDRSATLFDLCYGLPPAYRHNGKRHTDEAEAARIHPGLGDRPATEIIPLDITRWLQAHSTWKGGQRTRIQAVKRAFNYAVEQKLLKENPLRGMKVPKPRPRVTYLTDAQETALLPASGEAFAVALRVLIRTGMRPASSSRRCVPGMWSMKAIA